MQHEHAGAKASLTAEQERVREAVVDRGLSCFLTGCAGTGKSFLTGELIAQLQRKYGRARVAVTATTGIAACNIRGTTLHAFAGIGTGEGTAEELTLKVRRDISAYKRWRDVRCLVVDEISMLDGRLLDKLHAVACALRPAHAHQPFGGVRLLFVGDFFQLPPVTRGPAQDVTFAFEAAIWPRAVEAQFELRTVFRQAGDTEFIGILNSIRVGKCTPDIAARLIQTGREFDAHDHDGADVRATKLFAKNVDVDAMNAKEVAALPGELLCFPSKDWASHTHFREALAKSCLAPSELTLKPGAQVMLLRNLNVEAGLSNGTLGTFQTVLLTQEEGDRKPLPEPLLRVRFDTVYGACTFDVKPEKFAMELGGVEVASRWQHPLKLAYAITVHKAQGLTLPRAVLGLRDVFEYGQAYVALSRVRDLQGLRLLNFSPGAVKCHPRVLEFYAGLSDGKV